jgi:hypothetical protein
MGLDITAYSGLVLRPDAAPDEDGSPVDYDKFWRAYPETIEASEKHFPGRSDGIASGATYGFSTKFRFRAGSYGGYGEWRHWLARLVGYDSARDIWEQSDAGGPFVELIHFSDCEGVIGPGVAAKLAKDFAEWEERAAAWASDDGDDADDAVWFLQKYREWKHAFELAADGGAVEFH